MAHPRGAAGVLFLIAVTQFVLGITIAEALHPGYSAYSNTISDLGIGSSAIVFNSSAFILGLLIAIGTYLLRRVPDQDRKQAAFFDGFRGHGGRHLHERLYNCA